MFRSKKLSLVCCMMIVAGLLLSAAGYLLGGRVWGVGLNRGGVWVNSPNIEKRKGCHYVKETKELEAFTGMKVILWDERRTTVDAHQILFNQGKNGRKRKKIVDAVAASLILESYLDFKRMKQE